MSLKRVSGDLDVFDIAYMTVFELGKTNQQLLVIYKYIYIYISHIFDADLSQQTQCRVGTNEADAQT